MILIGEKINGTIPCVKEAIANRDADFIANRAKAQEEAGADFIDVCASTEPDKEIAAMEWLLEVVQDAVDTPVCIDSPNADVIVAVFGKARKPGMLNSVNDAGDKCEKLFPLIAGTAWQVIGLTCDKDGIPMETAKKVEIAKRIIAKADRYGVARENLHIDPCVMALSTMPTAMKDFQDCIRRIKAYAPTVKIEGAISNISFEMPFRKNINQKAMAYAIEAGVDSAIMDPCDRDMIATVYAAEALMEYDKSGRKYNRAFRKGLFGPKQD